MIKLQPAKGRNQTKNTQMKHPDFSSFRSQKVGQVPIRFGLIACLLAVVKNSGQKKVIEMMKAASKQIVNILFSGCAASW